MNEGVLNQLYLKDTAFQDLMQCRIFNVLLIASPYDAFMMEEDGRVEEQLYFEYVSLNLSSPPRVTRVSDSETALNELRSKRFDIIISMPGVDISETFDSAKRIKQEFSDIPIVVLTPFSREVSRRLEHEDMSSIDYVFSWLGNVDLLLAIIKLLEDKMNADHDINDVGVQLILLVEDSVRFYSSVLPLVYKFLLKQSLVFATEALNEHEQMLRMRGRPKVMLARDYEEAVELYQKFKSNMLGVISDVSFKRNGAKDSKAGLKLAHYLRECDPSLPIIIESSEVENRNFMDAFGGVFVDKNSKKLPVDLGEAIMANFGFGDFIIKDPDSGEEIMRINSLKSLQKHIFEIPSNSLYYHASRSDISRWLYSRAMFPIAEILKQHQCANVDEAPATKQLVFDLIVKYRKMKNRGVVAVFKRDRFDHYSNFARIGQGSLGGKGRGLAYIDSIIKKNPVCDNFDGVSISIPRSVVLCTDIFDEFMASNNLYSIALSDAPDDEILHKFLESELPVKLVEDFYALFDVVDRPLAVRSSSLLEDSHYQPFAGIYSTYMIPHCDDHDKMFTMLSDAIKGVYASVFYAQSKAYMNATRNVIDQEKMAVIIQEVIGDEHGDAYFPSFSGVGRSLNYYPINDEAAEDGVAQVAIGLGKYIVDGGRALRFSPRHPSKVLQTSTLDLALRETQTQFCALSNKTFDKEFGINDDFNIESRNVQDFAGDKVLNYMVSTYNAANEMIVDNNIGRGRRVVTFANVLRDKVYPLAPAIDFMLTTGQNAMGRPVEIEFSGDIDMQPGAKGANKGRIYWLQIRPIIDRKDMVENSMLTAADSEIILRSNTALGHGSIDAIHTIVYVRPENFSSLNNVKIAEELSKINGKYIESNENYILIGPGRWGSSDNALGIPVKWPDISQARLIVESALNNYRIEPSQGTHFFQNLTSFGVGYFTIDPSSQNGFYDLDYLNAQPAIYESEYVRIVRFDNPLRIGIDGRQSIGVVLKPQ
jgi:CheY-like chemotaxis protein